MDFACIGPVIWVHFHNPPKFFLTAYNRFPDSEIIIEGDDLWARVSSYLCSTNSDKSYRFHIPTYGWQNICFCLHAELHDKHLGQSAWLLTREIHGEYSSQSKQVKEYKITGKPLSFKKPNKIDGQVFILERADGEEYYYLSLPSCYW